MMSFTLGSIFGFTITTASFIWRSYRQGRIHRRRP